MIKAGGYNCTRGHSHRVTKRICLAIIGLALLGGCTPRAPVDPARLLPVLPEAVVRFDGLAAAALATHGRVEVWVARPDPPGKGTVNPITASAAVPPLEDRVLLLSYGGDIPEGWNTFVYGTAEPGTARVELEGFEGLGGKVVAGAWLIVLRETDVTPEQLRWRFVRPDGSVRRAGDGIRICAEVAPCGPFDPAMALPVYPPEGVVRFDRGAAVALVANGRVEVWISRLDELGNWTGGPITASPAVPAAVDRVFLFRDEGEPEEWNTFVYGTAEPGTARVELEGLEGVGGDVVAGAWLIVLRETDVTPEQLHWRFLRPDGSVRRAGEGIRTCTDDAPCPSEVG